MMSPPSHPHFEDTVTRPDPSSFLNPWAHGPLIRYLAWLRQLHGHIPLPAPSGDPLEGIALDALFVEPLLSTSPSAVRPGDEHGTLRLLDLLDQHRHVVVLGEAGSGRTTLCAWLVHALTDPAPNPVIERLGRLVPVVLPIGFLDLDEGVRTVEGLVARLAEMPFWTEGMDALFPVLLEQGQVLFVLDDLDGVEDAYIREALRDAILDGVWRYPAASWLITAEPGGYAQSPLRDPGDDLPPELADLPEAARPELQTWWLRPFSPHQVRTFAHNWQQVAHPDAPVAADALMAAVQASPEARGLASTPAMLCLLAMVHSARGDLPTDRRQLIDWVVAAWLAALDNVPGAELIPVNARRGWVEGMARAAEAERIAAWDQWVAAGAPGSLESRVRTPPVPWSQAFYLLRSAVVADGHPDPGPDDTARFVHGVAHRPGVLVARSGGLGFVRADQQRFLAAVHLAADLQQTPNKRAAHAAMHTLRGWSRIAASEDLLELFDVLDTQPGLAARVFDQLLDRQNLTDLQDLESLGPLALALQDARAPALPAGVQEAAREVVSEAVMRCAAERGRVPSWAPDLEPLREVGPLPALDLSGNTHIDDLAPIAGQRRMSRIELAGCENIRDIGPLATLSALRWADIRDCPQVNSVGALGALQNLRWLDLGGCTALDDLSPLSGLQGLQALVLHNCVAVEDLRPLCSIRSLRSLVISGCQGIHDLSPLKRLPRGGTVWVKGSGVRMVPPDLGWRVVGLD